MPPGCGQRRPARRRAAALLLAAALTVLAALGCGANLPRTAAAAATGGQLAWAAAAGAIPGLLAAPAHQVRAAADVPCPHAQIAPAVLGGDNASLKWAAPILLIAAAAAGMARYAQVRGPPPRPDVAALGGGRLLLHQLCVIRR
ncbi:hypothetical protein I543_0512 [Mycobacteroides abscessus 21]|nr:hypothetical protein I543_0512 [Mycobacteroides abscessus 21]